MWLGQKPILQYNTITMSKHQKFEKYRPTSPEDLTAKQLNFGIWWTAHKVGFRRLLIGVLAIIGVSGIGYGIYGVGNYFIVERSRGVAEHSYFVQPKVPFAAYHESLAPVEPSFGGVSVLEATGDLYDFVVRANNSNTDWYVTFDYQFVFGDRSTEFQSAMLVPDKETILGFLGYKTELRPSGAIINITNVQWRRISPHEAPDPAEYVEARNTMDIRNVQFFPGAQGTDGLKANRAVFTIQNNTAYNFWSIPTYVLLYQGSSLRAVEQTHIGELKSGEQRDVDVRSFKTGVKANNVEVYPYIPVFDETIYMPQ